MNYTPDFGVSFEGAFYVYTVDVEFRARACEQVASSEKEMAQVWLTWV
jgi:hypothetical protein